MKANRFARSALKTRRISLFLAAATMAGAGFALGDVLPVKRSKPASVIYHAPNVSLADAFNLATQ